MTPSTRPEDPKRSDEAVARELEEELARLRAAALLAQ